MKNSYLILVLAFMPISMFSQVETARSLKVINKTNCNQFFAVFGSEFCDCQNKFYMTALITIAPQDDIYYENSIQLSSFYIQDSTFLLDQEVGIYMVRIVDRDKKSECPSPPPSPEGGSIGQPCGNLPQSVTYRVKDNDCKVCADTKAEWIPTEDCKGVATLLFTEY